MTVVLMRSILKATQQLVMRSTDRDAKSATVVAVRHGGDTRGIRVSYVDTPLYSNDLLTSIIEMETKGTTPSTI